MSCGSPAMPLVPSPNESPAASPNAIPTVAAEFSGNDDSEDDSDEIFEEARGGALDNNESIHPSASLLSTSFLLCTELRKFCSAMRASRRRLWALSRSCRAVSWGFVALAVLRLAWSSWLFERGNSSDWESFEVVVVAAVDDEVEEVETDDVANEDVDFFGDKEDFSASEEDEDKKRGMNWRRRRESWPLVVATVVVDAADFAIDIRWMESGKRLWKPLDLICGWTKADPEEGCQFLLVAGRELEWELGMAKEASKATGSKRSMTTSADFIRMADIPVSGFDIDGVCEDDSRVRGYEFDVSVADE